MKQEFDSTEQEGIPTVDENANSQPPKQELDTRTNESAAASYKGEWFSGPLPHPEDLQKYEQIAPGSATVIINNMLAESSHRRETEKKVLADGIMYANRGLSMAFHIAAGGIGAGLIISLFSIFLLGGIPQITGIITGSALSGSVIVALVHKFIDGASTKKINEPKYDAEMVELENLEEND